MSAYKEYLTKKSKDELVGIILQNNSTAKAVRNDMMKKEFEKVVNELPRMDAYSHLSVTYGVSEQMAMKIVKE